ncbi:minichromosome maintenance domain-containing protein 2 [Sabethes cyaneus]|uniref:minichromosome maintenance domain-containing protein 2 n=1 Tax=Sabethes cyaneus TaxID=53552 RepID=UPI00237DBB5B|nr:minichromosome maintenance domain-containing protein 2 [Sabethes cyaneus]
MDFAVGLVSDPDELREVSRVAVVGTTYGSSASDGLVVEETEADTKTDVEQTSQDGLSQQSEDLFVVPTDHLKVEIGEDELNVLMTQDTEPLSVTFSGIETSSGVSEAPIGLTMTFPTNEAIEAAQGWTFSQQFSPVDAGETQNTFGCSTTDIEIKEENSVTAFTSLYQEVSPIPNSIRELYTSVTEQYSDFCFSYLLAAQLCQDAVPTTAYNSLKLSLLLSIASIQKSSQNQPFHVIALGADTAISHRLMSSIGQLARRFVTGMLDPLAGGHVLDDNFVECGATTLARTGVCYIGDWAMQKPSNSVRILREIESGLVIIENHAITYPLECAIWTCWNYTRKAKQDLTAVLTFLNAFGIPVVLPEETPASVVDFILERSLVGFESADQEVLVSEQDVRQFLKMMYCQEVSFSEEAEQLLGDYFVTTRLTVPESLTQTSFFALRKLTEAHARLCFRNHATRLDVMVAIMICERFIHSVFSNPGNAAPLMDTFTDIDELEQYLYRFDCWLKEFLRNSTPR